MACVRSAGVGGRTVVRGFDHRAVRAIRRLESGLTGAVWLAAGTIPVVPASLATRADATIYCPDYRFVDEALMTVLRSAGVRVLPWTVNRPAEWDRLRAWGVDGICTDFPNLLAASLQRKVNSGHCDDAKRDAQ